MLLSSVNRLRRFTGLGDTPEETYFLATFLASVSAVMQDFLERDYELKQRTEYFDPEELVREIYPKAWPVTAITSIHSSHLGTYTGEEVAESNYYIGTGGRSIILYRAVPPYPKGLRAIYTGGVATHPVNSAFTLSSVGATAPEYSTGEKQQWVRNEDYSALGIVRGWDAGTSRITIENLYGIFKVSDTLVFSAKEGGEALENTSGTISAIFSQSFVEAKPNVALAIENEIRFLQKNKDRFETQGVSKDGSTTKRAIDGTVYALQPETKTFLWNEKREIL